MSGELRLSAGRVWAMLLRYLYLLRSSWPRTLELLYWPTLQMLIWGFMSQFLYSNSSYVFRAFGVLLAAVMLWDVLFRGQLGLSMSFLEEMWARNLGHLFVTPLRPYEWVLSLLSMSMIRVLLGITPAALLAIPLYHYSIFAMGLPLLAFFAVLLVMGWALGLAICGLILRQGMGAEGLAWTVVFTISPIRSDGSRENGMPDIKIVTEVAGRVCALPVTTGGNVGDGDEIAFVEAMKMEIPVTSTTAGKIKAILVKLDDVIAEGQVVAIIEA